MAVDISLTFDRIDWESLTQTFHSPKCGAIASFLGTTRDSFGDKQVVELSYECYDPLARKMMDSIAQKAIETFQLETAVIHHRLGTVKVKEASIFVLVASKHRKEAFEAVAWIMDEVKANVPIWKKEIYTDGSVWKENAESKRCCK
jgi:molybdopterin synthase catalytic subunit